MATINSWNSNNPGVSIAIGTAGSNTISIGNTSSGAVAIDCGTAGISVGTTSNAHTSTFGSTNSTSTTTVQSGSGGITLTGAVTSANAISITSGSMTITSGNLNLPASTSSVGTINIASTPFIRHIATGNTFVGLSAGNFTLSGQYNCILGDLAGSGLTTGNENVFIGGAAGNAATTGNYNVGIAHTALTLLTTGSSNTAIGFNGTDGALNHLTTGSTNVAIGADSGKNYTSSESSNILILNQGTVSESNVIRIGTSGSGAGQQNKCFIAGINGITNGGASSVPYIDTNGQLGTTPGGAVTMNTGTQSLSISSDASATTVNIATGAAAKVVTLGSTNGASSLALKTGTADFSLASATGTIMSALDTGEINYPLQPAFEAIRTTQVTDVTGDGALYTIVYNSEIFDQNSDFDGTSTFTAPVTGRYFFSVAVNITDLTVTNTSFIMNIVTSNRTYYYAIANAGTFQVGGSIAQSGALLVDMDIGDTTVTQVAVAGSTKIVDINSGGATDPRTVFSGYLVC